MGNKITTKPVEKADDEPFNIRSQEDAMEYLRKNCPMFFEDESMKGLAAMIVAEMADELRWLSKVQRVSVIATTIGLMYKMGSAAIRSISDKKRNMTRICLDEYLERKRMENSTQTQDTTHGI